MPADDGVRLYDEHPVSPAAPEARQQNPEQPVGLLEAETMLRAPLEHNDLVTQRSDLGLLGGAGLKSRGKQSEQGNEDRAHCENDDDLTNDLNVCIFNPDEFSATTAP